LYQRHRVLVTGTPIQNSLDELWALFDYAANGELFGDHKTFKQEFEVIRFAVTLHFSQKCMNMRE
jgi:SWI/SNF-related matrix-associated actin-dependent regulator of chromatin subfamily A member 5